MNSSLVGKYINIDNNMWADCGIVYEVLEENRYPNTTRVKLKLRSTDDSREHVRNVPSHQIHIV